MDSKELLNRIRNLPREDYDALHDKLVEAYIKQLHRERPFKERALYFYKKLMRGFLKWGFGFAAIYDALWVVVTFGMYESDTVHTFIMWLVTWPKVRKSFKEGAKFYDTAQKSLMSVYAKYHRAWAADRQAIEDEIHKEHMDELEAIARRYIT